MGDVVIVVNAAHLQFTGDKWDTKVYKWHSGKHRHGRTPSALLLMRLPAVCPAGYPGGLKTRTAVEQWDRDPTEVSSQLAPQKPQIGPPRI